MVSIDFSIVDVQEDKNLVCGFINNHILFLDLLTIILTIVPVRNTEDVRDLASNLINGILVISIYFVLYSFYVQVNIYSNVIVPVFLDRIVEDGVPNNIVYSLSWIAVTSVDYIGTAVIIVLNRVLEKDISIFAMAINDIVRLN